MGSGEASGVCVDLPSSSLGSLVHRRFVPFLGSDGGGLGSLDRGSLISLLTSASVADAPLGFLPSGLNVEIPHEAAVLPGVSGAPRRSTSPFHCNKFAFMELGGLQAPDSPPASRRKVEFVLPDSAPPRRCWIRKGQPGDGFQGRHLRWDAPSVKSTLQAATAEPVLITRAPRHEYLGGVGHPPEGPTSGICLWWKDVSVVTAGANESSGLEPLLDVPFRQRPRAGGEAPASFW